jgi:hypothetical protein
MTRYLVTHTVKEIYESQERLIEGWRGLRQRCGPTAQWLRSLYAPAAGRLFCEWEADSPESVRACFRSEELEMAPIERIDEVAFLDPVWLDEDAARG